MVSVTFQKCANCCEPLQPYYTVRGQDAVYYKTCVACGGCRPRQPVVPAEWLSDHYAAGWARGFLWAVLAGAVGAVCMLLLVWFWLGVVADR